MLRTKYRRRISFRRSKRKEEKKKIHSTALDSDLISNYFLSLSLDDSRKIDEIFVASYERFFAEIANYNNLERKEGSIAFVGFE